MIRLIKCASEMKPDADHPCIPRFAATAFGCLRSVSVAITPLHAFIGPNDSGKTTLLRALHAVLNLAHRGNANVSAALLEEGTTLQLELTEVDAGRYRYRGDRWESEWLVRGVTKEERDSPAPMGDLSSAFVKDATTAPLLRGARMLRLDSEALRAPSPLLTKDQLERFFVERGRGLPAVLDLILGRGDTSYNELSERVRRLFPMVKRIGIRPIDQGTKQIEVELQDGTVVSAEHISDGLLMYVAFEAIRYIDPVSMLLVEEPENGLHPSRISEVIDTLKAISEAGTQVVIATHSPVVVNELQPDQVSIVTRTQEHGTKVTPIADTPNFKDRYKVYELGELWLSYADGEQESALLEPPPKSQTR